MTNQRFPILDSRNYKGKLKPSSSRRRRLSFEQLEYRRLLATVQWDGGGNGTAWSDPLNWVGDSLPTAADDAIINVPSSDPVINVSGNNTVKSLVTSEVITFNVGTFTTPSIQLNAVGSIAGATIVGANFSGSGTLQVTSASGTLNGVTLGLDTTLREGTAGLGNQVTVLNNLTLANNSVLRLEVTSTGCDRNFNTSEVGLNFSGGAQVLSGTGSVELFASAYVYGCGTNPGPEDRDVRVRPTGTGSSLTIGPNITVHNTGSSDLTSLGDPSLPLIIQGTVSARSSTLRVNGASVTNTGVLQVTNGVLDVNNLFGNVNSTSISTGTLDLDGAYAFNVPVNVPSGALTLRGNWINSSAIHQTGGTIHLGGTFTVAELGTFTGTSGTVSIFGTLDGTNTPTNETLTIDSVRQWQLAGGTLKNVTVTGGGDVNKPFQITSASGTLDNVTLGWNTTLRQGTTGSGNQVTVFNGLTLANNSVLRLELPSNGCDRNYNSSEVGLNFSGGTQVLSGTGSVELFASAYVYGCGTNPGPEDRDVRVRPTGTGSSLTIGPGVTVHNAGSSDLTSLGDPLLPLIIQGTVSARSSGLRINGSAVTNTGTLQGILSSLAKRWCWGVCGSGLNQFS